MLVNKIARIVRNEVEHDEKALQYIKELPKLIKSKLKSDREEKRVQINIVIWEIPEMESKCVESIIHNTYWPYKIEVYSNKDYNGLHVNRINLSKIWNKMVRESSSDYIVFLDPDTLVEPNWLEKMMAVMNEYEDCGVVVPVCNKDGSTTFQNKGKYDLWPHILNSNQYASGFCFLFRKQVWKEIGKFDEDFYLFGQDSDWFERIRESKWNIYVHPQVYIHHGWEGDTSAQSRKAERQGKIHWDTESLYSGLLIQEKRKLRKVC